MRGSWGRVLVEHDVERVWPAEGRVDVGLRVVGGEREVGGPRDGGVEGGEEEAEGPDKVAGRGKRQREGVGCEGGAGGAVSHPTERG